MSQTRRNEAANLRHDTEQWFRTLAESVSAAIFVYGSEQLVYANAASEALTGYSIDELLATTLGALGTPETRCLIRDRALARLRGEPVPSRYEASLVTKSGSLRWIEMSAARIDRAGEPLALATAIDITERKEAEAALAREKELAQVTLASIGEGIVRTDARGVIDYLNPEAERLTGWSCEEAAGLPLVQVFRMAMEEGGEMVSDPVALCLAQGRAIEPPEPFLLVRRDGVELSIRETVAPIRDAEGRIAGSVLVFKDVTELRCLERELAFLARHDPLTGLLNRREFERHLAAALRTAQSEGRQHALFYFDLDEFKLVNDTCGHLAGDELLKHAAHGLRSPLRITDTLARLGSDEFGVLIEDVGVETARALGEAMRQAIRRARFHWQDRSFDVRVSVGLVPIDEASDDLASLLSAADAACYVAKENGRNRIHEYQPDDSRVALRYGEMQWIHRIHQAFDESRFCLYHQRIEPLACGGSEPPLSEIFIRMRDDDGRLITPGAFIPAAERYHLISAIDRWVLHTAFGSLTRGSQRSDARFAINLSGQSLGEETFLDVVLSEIAASGVAPERLYFEITETAAVANLAHAGHFIAALKSLGCHFVLDDFGSGLSSFAYLKNLRVDFLKIDGGFVRDMMASSVQRALVASIHQLGKVMGIRTIAESVEDRPTLEALRQIGVDYAQGYILAQPEPLQ